ncbi:MAG: hypothetical protein Q9214_005401 [Letrouitia sp. 1 TL-2023]
MTDTKRPNLGKASVATPNIGPSGMVSLENALSGAIGARIRLQTTLPAQPTLEGILFTACPLTNLIAISVSTTASNPPTHHIIPVSSIQSFTLLPTSPGSNGFSSALGNTSQLNTLPTASLLARADAAVARLKEAASRKNKSVGREAQELFDGLGRTLPTRWDGTSIVVMDEVLISAPYRGEDCKAKAGVQAHTLNRVRKVVSLSSLHPGEHGWKRAATDPDVPQ